MTPTLVLVLLLGLPTIRPEPISKHAGMTYFGNYEPRIPKSLEEIPEAVRARALSHLRDRLGESFYSRLKFSGGQVVDLGELRRVQPDSANFEWEVFSYNLHFRFEMPEFGIASYTAETRLRSDGSVIEEIDLPAFSISPEKLNFFALQDAVAVAADSGYSYEKMSVELRYSKEADALIWRFMQTVADDGLHSEFKYLDVSAHSGAVIKSSIGTSVR